MRYRSSKSSDQNFWVSYADLMAGLLFVFILLIGAIVVKYVYVQTDLKGIKNDLEAQTRVLRQSQEELLRQKQDFLRLKTDMNATSASLQIAQELLMRKESDLNASNAKLQLSDQEIENLPANTPVLLAVDYEPGYTGELKAISSVVLQRLMHNQQRLAA
ncbi:MAG: hypothetical protein EOM49_06530, partial [Epsilonproteobacteria bacterium]|nr:hypothetical protein [Campylobacterota bacterium]